MELTKEACLQQTPDILLTSYLPFNMMVKVIMPVPSSLVSSRRHNPVSKGVRWKRTRVRVRSGSSPVQEHVKVSRSLENLEFVSEADCSFFIWQSAISNECVLARKYNLVAWFRLLMEKFWCLRSVRNSGLPENRVDTKVSYLVNISWLLMMNTMSKHTDIGHVTIPETQTVISQTTMPDTQPTINHLKKADLHTTVHYE